MNIFGMGKKKSNCAITEKGKHELEVKNPNVLRLKILEQIEMNDNGMGVSDIASELCVPQASVENTVDRLIKEGMIRKC
jgi:predicted transcriptional regulator